MERSCAPARASSPMACGSSRKALLKMTDSLPPVIVGAGPAGSRAAAILVAAGLRPVVIDEAPRSGGQIHRRQPPGLVRPLEPPYGLVAAKPRPDRNQCPCKT